MRVLLAVVAALLLSLGNQGSFSHASDVVTSVDVIQRYEIPLRIGSLEEALFNPGSDRRLRENIVAYLLKYKGQVGGQIVARAISTGPSDLVEDTLRVLRFDVENDDVVVALRAVVENSTQTESRLLAVVPLARSGDCTTLESLALSDTEPSQLRVTAIRGLWVAQCSQTRPTLEPLLGDSDVGGVVSDILGRLDAASQN